LEIINALAQESRLES